MDVHLPIFDPVGRIHAAVRERPPAVLNGSPWNADCQGPFHRLFET
jgi:hypothetical protein